MKLRNAIARITQHEALNFVLTNRIPRRLLTRLTARFGRIENRAVRALSIRVWRLFCDVELSDARKSEFKSLHDCFVRELRPGARPVDPDTNVVVSPCDAIVGACGTAVGGEALQIKGSAYPIAELLGDPGAAAAFRDCVYATLRLTAGMYHRFHAPHDLTVTRVTHIGGDVWNVNPTALKRVSRLYCRNERAVIRAVLSGGEHAITMVPVAAVLVAGIRLRFLELTGVDRETGAAAFECTATFAKGEEMGWFEHGSTIVILAPRGFHLCPSVRPGGTIRMGEPLMRLP